MKRTSSDGNSALIGRRKGTSFGGRKRELILNPKSVLVLAALCATIFLTGLVLGTHLMGKPDERSTDVSNSSLKNAEASPLAAAAAAANKIAASDIQNLILQSAQAEIIEKKQREQEAEAVKRGDTALALHLRGALAPGDPNYNPHHHIDDAIEAGDGAIYENEGQNEQDLNHAQDERKDSGQVPEGPHSEENELPIDGRMNHQFLQAVTTDKKAVVDAMKEKFVHYKEKAADVVKHGLLRGALPLTANRTIEEQTTAWEKGTLESQREESIAFPYMTAPISENYTFATYEPLGGGRFTEYKDGDSPYSITKKLMEQSDALARSRRVHVLNAMKHIWKNYREKAFGEDEIHPVSGRSTSNWGGMGTTLVDALDTLWLMGLKEEFWEGRDWVRDHLTHANVGDVSVFETTIRSLGGLLSAYDLSGDKSFLDKADDLGSRLLKSFDTPSGLPRGSVNLRSGDSHNFAWNNNQYSLAEVGTVQIEFRYLAQATGKPDYAKKAEKVFDILNNLMPEDGLIGEGLKERGSEVYISNNKVSFGAMSDSAYEYMLKIWLQGGRKEKKYRDMWDKSMNGMHSQLLQKSTPNGLFYIADRLHKSLDHKMDHLACFMGGTLSIGAYTDPEGFDSPRAKRDLKTAKALTYTCYQMYARSKTGISPEYVNFQGENDFSIPPNAPYYILRPETVEAFYYLNKLTGDPIYREWGWEVFQSIEKYCKTTFGYGSLKNVDSPWMAPEDRMESFFLAETLKYLYLLFDPDSEIDILNKHVFNTEAHPVRIFENYR